MTEELPEYSRLQLALKNGQDSSEIWVSYKGLYTILLTVKSVFERCIMNIGVVKI